MGTVAETMEIDPNQFSNEDQLEQVLREDAELRSLVLYVIACVQ